MRIHKRRVKKGKYEYEVFSMSLRKEEALSLLKLGNEFYIKDIDPKGEVILGVKNASSMAELLVGDERVKVTLNLNVSKRTWREFMDIAHESGSNACHIISDLVVYTVKKRYDPFNFRPIIINVFTGVPRGKKKLIYRSDKVNLIPIVLDRSVGE